MVKFHFTSSALLGLALGFCLVDLVLILQNPGLFFSMNELTLAKFSLAKLSLAKLSLTMLSLAKLGLTGMSLAEMSLAELSLAKLSLAKLSLAELSLAKFELMGSMAAKLKYAVPQGGGGDQIGLGAR